MEFKFRCECPITTALDILGDKWILVIIKQMLIEDKKTFKDFIESDEAIATNFLTSKLILSTAIKSPKRFVSSLVLITVSILISQ